MKTQYSFAHLLIRDVAYAQLPRTARAEKHEQAAGWIDSSPMTEAKTRRALAHHYLAALELVEARR